MTPTDVDRRYNKKVENRDGVDGQICLECQVWVPVKEKGEHFQQEHAR